MIMDVQPGTLYIVPDGRTKKDWYAKVIDGRWNLFVVLDNDEVIQARILDGSAK